MAVNNNFIYKVNNKSVVSSHLEEYLRVFQSRLISTWTDTVYVPNFQFIYFTRFKILIRLNIEMYLTVNCLGDRHVSNSFFLLVGAVLTISLKADYDLSDLTICIIYYFKGYLC